MSRGSKIYRRFGLKWALAYRFKKIKRKIKQNTPLCLQKALMFLRILKLKNTNKLQIYKILTQCHCIIEKQEHLEFVAKHYEEINSWLNSNEFKTKYIDTNHPYPPLLNSDKLNGDSTASLKETNAVRDEASVQSTDPHLKIHNLNNQNLTYHNIPAELAWDLNLPLPRRYRTIWCLFGLSGCAAFGNFLAKIGCSPVLLMNGSFNASYKRAYTYLQEKDLEMLVWISFEDTQESHRKKLFALMDSEVPVLINVRDSIGRLKAGVNHGSFKTTKTQYSIDNPMKLLVDRVAYSGQDKPHLDILGKFTKGNAFCGSPEIWIYDRIVQMLPNAKYIKYLDMQEIVGERTFETMTKLAKEFGFPAPKEEDREFFTSKIYNQYNYLLPITIQVDKTIQIEVQQQIFAPKDKIDILSNLSLDSLGLKIGFFVSKEKEIELLNNKSLCKEVAEKLQEYIGLLKEKTISVEANKVTESQVLEYLKENPATRKVYKSYFDDNFTHLKANRPDIVESWKYYQEFMRMCKELD